MNIDFNSDKFNILFKILKKNEYNNKRFSLMRGGAGSGKSYAMAEFMLYQCIRQPINYMVVRKTGSSLKDSVVKLIILILKRWGLQEYYKYNKTDKEFSFFNGSNIICKGIDDGGEKLKSLTDLDNIWIEEGSELEDIAIFNQLNLRLRGKPNQKIYITFNPVSMDNYLYKRFYENYDRENCDYTITTYRDNMYTDQQYKDQIEFYKTYDYDYYRIYGDGNWGTLRTGYEFYKWKETGIVKDIKKNHKGKVIHISLDENVVPYISATISLIEGKNVYIIKEYALEDPYNNIYDLCTYIKNDFKGCESVYIYGDATSNKRDTKLKNGENFFSLIMKELEIFRPELRLPRSNPPVKTRGNWINQIFNLKRDGISINIDSSCRKLIEDFNNVKQEADGTKSKKKYRDPKSKMSYEKYGHLSDSIDYLLCQAFREDFYSFKDGGKVDIQIPQEYMINKHMI